MPNWVHRSLATKLQVYLYPEPNLAYMLLLCCCCSEVTGTGAGASDDRERQRENSQFLSDLFQEWSAVETASSTFRFVGL